MSQHLTNAVDSLTREIERLTQVRDQLSEIADESEAGRSSLSRETKSATKKSGLAKGVSAKRRGRPPVSEGTRKKMADARRAFFARRTPAAKKAVTKKTVAKKAVAKKTSAKKGSAKKAATKSATNAQG